MSPFLSWYLLTTFLGWLTFPLAHRLFPALADRGYTLSRAFGLLIWGYIFWLFAMLGIAQNDMGGLLLGLVVLVCLSMGALIRSPILPFLQANRPLILTTELLFLLAFGFMALVRAANPEIVGTEKPMELMFINGIMNSPTFPPRDLWLSGYSISYYYFGYVMTSMLALFTGVPGTVAFNLMIALIFALSATGAYGVLYNLLASSKSSVNSLSSLLFPLFAPLFLLILSNAEGFLEILHKSGFLWKEGPNFWTWLDIPELRDPPPHASSWLPDRFWWWWRASRVIMDYDLQNNWMGDVISEFPAFSYILGDLHPHVLAMPFTLLAVAVALNLFLGGWRGRINLYFGELRIHKAGFFVSALVLGGLAFLNTWDILTGAALIVSGYALVRVAESGWGWERIEDILLLGIPLVVTSLVMYLPFYIGFDSQAGGLIPSFMFPTRGAQLWVMWGTLFIPLFAFLFYLQRIHTPANWRTGTLTALCLVLVLLVAMFAIGLFAWLLKPNLVEPILASQGRDVATFIADSMKRRLSYSGGLLTLLALLIPSFSFLFSNSQSSADEVPSRPAFSTFHFSLLLTILGVLLILTPDFIYLRDNFGYRINTVFKFYYQAWILLSLASAYGTIVLLKNLRGASNVIFTILFTLVLLIGLTYPVLGFLNKTNHFKPPFGFTLDDFDRLQRENPDEAAAILWLKSAPDGIILEATGNPYSSVGRISIYSGRPTILGWSNHEGQWRGTDFQGILAQRTRDIETLYTISDWQTTHALLQQYNVRYVIVGGLERSSYRVNEEKFNNFLSRVFQQGSVTIYEVP